MGPGLVGWGPEGTEAVPQPPAPPSRPAPPAPLPPGWPASRPLLIIVTAAPRRGLAQAWPPSPGRAPQACHGIAICPSNRAGSGGGEWGCSSQLRQCPGGGCSPPTAAGPVLGAWRFAGLLPASTCPLGRGSGMGEPGQPTSQEGQLLGSVPQHLWAWEPVYPPQTIHLVKANRYFRPGCKTNRGEKRHFPRKYEMRRGINGVETQAGSRWLERHLCLGRERWWGPEVAGTGGWQGSAVAGEAASRSCRPSGWSSGSQDVAGLLLGALFTAFQPTGKPPGQAARTPGTRTQAQCGAWRCQSLALGGSGNGCMLHRKLTLTLCRPCCPGDGCKSGRLPAPCKRGQCHCLAG